jgi:hypothetical protein
MPPKKQAKKVEKPVPKVEYEPLQKYTDQELIKYMKIRKVKDKLPQAEAQVEIFNKVMPELEKITSLTYRNDVIQREDILVRDLRTYHKILQQEIVEMKSEAT